jgi:hypothetical protein
MIADTKYGVHQKISALDNAVTEQAKDHAALRAEFTALEQKVQSLIDMNKQSAEYIEFLRAQVAARSVKR